MVYKKMLITALLFNLFLLGSAQTVTEIEGLVEIRKSVNSAWLPVAVDTELNLGASLRSFSGNATIKIADSIIKISNNTTIHRLAYYPQSFEVIEGKAYVKSDSLVFFVNGPLEIFGEAVFATKSNLKKATVISGYIKAIVESNALKIMSGEQLNNLGDKTEVVNAYPEYPWYKGLELVDTGKAKVIGYSGKAEILKNEWRTVSLNDVFESGESIKTFEMSWLELSFGDSLIRLQSNTELSLKEWANYSDGTSRTVLELKRGKVWAIVDNGGQPFEIETPGLIAGVRGTKFRLDSSENDLPPLIKTFDGKVAGVEDSKFTEIEKGKQFNPIAGLEKLVLDDLDRFNLEKDKQLDKPSLFVARLDYIASNQSIIIKGMSNADTVTVNGNAVELKDKSFSLTLRLESGMNYIVVIARNTKSGSENEIVRAVIRK